MDELDLIQSFRADVPGPSSLARERAGRAWADDLARRSRRPWPSRPIPVAVAAAVAVSIAALVLAAGRGGLGERDALAAQTLQRAAVAAEADGLRAPRPGEYVYMRVLERYEGGLSRTTESWIAPGGDWRVRWRWASGKVEDRSWGRVRPIQFGATALTYRQLLEMPTNPAALLARVEKEARRNPDVHVSSGSFTIVSDVLRRAPLPAELQAAFFRAAARIPGIAYIAEARDIAGREGVGVSLKEPGRTEVLVFDSDSGRLLGSHQAAGAQGRVVNGTASFETGIVSSARDRP